MPAGVKESTKRYLFHVRLILLQRLCQLIRAGSWAEAALDAFDAGDCLVDIHAFDQAGNALGVAGAAAGKTNVFYDAVFKGKVDLSGTYAVGGAGIRCHNKRNLSIRG